MRRLFLAASILALSMLIGSGTATAQSAVDLCSRGSDDEKIVGCGILIKQNPRRQDAHAAYHNRGKAWSEKGDYDKAIADYNEAIRLDPKFAIAYHNRGGAWGSKGDYDKAIADYNEVIRLDP